VHLTLRSPVVYLYRRMSELIFRERPSAAEARGLLILHHGRGTDENDLFGLADLFDPKKRLHVVTPRAPLPFPGSTGYRWYETPRTGFPDPDTFHRSYGQLAAFHDSLWERTGLTPEHTVLGGFSMGTVMSYALGLGGDRPAPAGILALSGFIPTVSGWEPSLGDRTATKVFIAHGTNDPVIGIDFARQARGVLEAAGFDLRYHESPAAHHIDPRVLPDIGDWITATLDR
jgi:phospholipase/carboxylesterase